MIPKLFLLVPLFIASTILAHSPAPVSLRCELLKGNELKNIANPLPNFAWVVPITRKGGVQSSYSIQVARARMDFDQKESLLWDSGDVNSKESLGIQYKGEPLQPGETYRWRVRVGVENGAYGHWSEPQRFTMAHSLSDSPSVHSTQGSLVAPLSVVELEPGRYLIDFGRVAFGYLQLNLVTSAVGDLSVHFGERGSKEGVLRELPEKSSVRYYKVNLPVVAGKGVYGVHPPQNVRNTKPIAIEIPGRFGTIAPFRYVEIESNGIELKELTANQVAIHYPWDDYASFFRSSNKDLDALWNLCKYSMKATSFAGVYVDGDRERIPYEADAYINMLSHYAVDSEYSIGRYTHEYLMDYETWPTEWKQHSVMMAYVDYLYTGDISSLRRTYDRLKKYKTLEHLAREDGLLVSHPYPNQAKRTGNSADIVDWPPVERDGYVFKEVNTVVNAFHYLNLRQMAELARAIGREAEARDYSQRSARLYARFNELLFDEKTGLYVDGIGTNHSAFHANLFPLAFGLVPEHRKKLVAEFIVSKDLACSVYAAQYLLEALYEGGQEDAALRLMTMKGKRSWQNMLAVGSTITLEAWDDSFKPNQDWNHAWGSAPGNVIARYLLGVRPLTPGFEDILIAPRIGSLTFIEGRVPTIRGSIDVSVRQILGESMSVSLQIPGNTKPIISLKIPEGNLLKSLSVNGEDQTFAVDSRIFELTGLKSGSHDIKLLFE